MPWSLKRVATLSGQVSAIVTAVVTIGSLVIPGFGSLLGDFFGALGPALREFRDNLNGTLGTFDLYLLQGLGDVALVGFGIILLVLLMYQRSPIRVRAFEIWWTEQRAKVKKLERAGRAAKSRRARAHKRKAA